MLKDYPFLREDDKSIISVNTSEPNFPDFKIVTKIYFIVLDREDNRLIGRISRTKECIMNQLSCAKSLGIMAEIREAKLKNIEKDYTIYEYKKD